MTTIAEPTTVTTAPRILAHYAGIKVKIIDCFQMQHGERLAVVEAVNGTPFVGGDKWPIYTNRTIVDVGDLESFVLILNAHGHQWAVLKSSETYDLQRFDDYAGVPLPKFICSTSLFEHLPKDDRLITALRHLAKRAGNICHLLDDSEYFSFLYVWVEQ